MTDIFFSFDTEDFTDGVSDDALLREAELLRENGIVGNFNVVGDLAKALVEHKRYDVLEALHHHDISFHSAHHSVHPTLSEYTDIEDYAEPLTLTADQVRQLAKSVDLNGFFPTHFVFEGKTVGVADLLFAMLDVAMGKGTVTVLPKKQQCDLPKDAGRYFGETLRGTWLFSKDFKDEHLTRRLMLQAWTVLHEDKAQD